MGLMQPSEQDQILVRRDAMQSSGECRVDLQAGFGRSLERLVGRIGDLAEG